MERFETLTVTTFVDVVTKLNDAAFKPIYRRLFDWAFNDVTGSTNLALYSFMLTPSILQRNLLIVKLLFHVY